MKGINLLTRLLSSLLCRRYDAISILPTPDNPWIGLIPVDLWMYIVSEWIDHVKWVIALEYALGYQHSNKWIYGSYGKLYTPCAVKIHEIDRFLSWKRSHGNITVTNLTLKYTASLRRQMRWEDIGDVEVLHILNYSFGQVEPLLSLSSLLQALPRLKQLSLPAWFIRRNNDHTCQTTTVTSSLKSLTLCGQYLERIKPLWESIIRFVESSLPQLESLEMYGCNLEVFLNGAQLLHKLKVIKISSENVFSPFDRIASIGNTPPTEVQRTQYDWEDVSIKAYRYLSAAYDWKKYFLLLSKCPRLTSFKLKGAEIPNTFVNFGAIWKQIRVIELNKVIVTQEQLLFLIDNYGSQLHSFSLDSIDNTARYEHNAPTDCGWFASMLLQSAQLQTLELKDIPLGQETDVIQKWLRCPSPTFQQSLQRFSLKIYDFPTLLNSPILCEMLGSCHNLREIELEFVAETSVKATNLLTLLMEHCNRDVLDRFVLIVYLEHLPDLVQTEGLLTKQEMYELHAQYLTNSKPFARLKYLKLNFSVTISHELLIYILKHSPHLQHISLNTSILTQKVVIAPRSIPQEAIDIIEQLTFSQFFEMFSHFVRKRVYFTYHTIIRLDTPASIRALISDSYVNCFYEMLKVGGIAPLDVMNKQYNEDEHTNLKQYLRPHTLHPYFWVMKNVYDSFGNLEEEPDLPPETLEADEEYIQDGEEILLEESVIISEEKKLRIIRSIYDEITRVLRNKRRREERRRTGYSYTQRSVEIDFSIVGRNMINQTIPQQREQRYGGLGIRDWLQSSRISRRVAVSDVAAPEEIRARQLQR
jgi:hypothetical protein